MDRPSIPNLPSLNDAHAPALLHELPELHPGFFIPRLTDKPQNPIMDTISLLQRTRHTAHAKQLLPNEVEALAEDTWVVAEASLRIEKDLWQQVAQEKASDRHRLMSWETLRGSFNLHKIPPAFLSQQSTHVFASARHYTRPRVHDPTKPLIYVTREELLQSLHLTLTGLSSSVYVWDSHVEKFRLRAVPEGKKGMLVLIGTDEVISESIVARLLSIGSLTRRLEILVQEYSIRHSRADQITHAFIHALSSVLDHLRMQLADSVDANVAMEPSGLTAVWARYGPLEEVLAALGQLCRRQLDVAPSEYNPLPRTAADLLSRVYQQLNEALESSLPHNVTAILAYILTLTSKDYFRDIGESVGYNASTTHSTKVASRGDDNLGLGAAEDDVEEQDDTFEEDQPSEELYPAFIQAALCDAFPRAKRSLRLLREARPDHPLLRGREDGSRAPDIRWFWTEADIEAAWTGRRVQPQPANPLANALHSSPTEGVPALGREYKEELKAFTLFDLAPGQRLGLIATAMAQSETTNDLRSFIEAFPSSLPSLAPTMSHLTNLVLSPLAKHMEALSGALVTLFLSPTDLNLPLHLSILRSYLLLTSHSFKSRLAAALFSDSDDSPDLATKASTRRRDSDGNAPLAQGRWAVGLSPALTAANIWPPSVPELSFRLRTVINDSLQSSLGSSDEQSTQVTPKDIVTRDAEHRLGFAIRDLPTGTGKEKWLDPLSIEALDFLYLDYKPPRPLHVVITPDVLSKYHRIFAFNLRIMRALNAIAATYRITRRHSAPLFPTLTPSNKLLLHARFVAHAFVSVLSSYIYDRAIGLRFDDFLSQLTSSPAAQAPTFADVFALAERHSTVLDDILSACLLRSGQKAVGDVLRTCLELVLELAVLAGDRYQGRLEEYQAAPLLEDIWEKFRKKMRTLIKVLRALVERGSGTSRETVADVEAQLASLSRLDGVTGSLHDLVTRLDVADWWIRR